MRRGVLPRTGSSKGGASCGGLLVTLLLLLAVACLAVQHADATTVRHGVDNSEDLQHSAAMFATHERGNLDIIALQSLRNKGDQLFALERRDDGDHGNVVVRLSGHGRHRSDGISIIHTLGAKDPSENAAIAFTPPQIDVEWVETCEPVVFTVLAENRSPRPLHIQDVRFEHDAFQLASDPRGVILEPGQKLRLEVLLVASEPEQFQSLVFLVTSAGEFALRVRGLTRISKHQLLGLRVSVPTGSRLEHTISFHNPQDNAMRITEAFSLDGVGDIFLPVPVSESVSEPAEQPAARNRAAKSALWVVPTRTTKTIARFVFTANKPPGRYRSSIQLITENRQFLVPVQIDVWEEQFVIEPRDVDIGVFTSDEELRQVLVTFHNTGAQPVSIRGLRVIDSDGVDASAELQGTSSIIPPRSRVQHAVQLTIRSGHAHSQRAGPCSMQLQFQTNASSADNNHHTIKIRGFSMRGHLSYPLEQTTFRVVKRITDNAQGKMNKKTKTMNDDDDGAASGRPVEAGVSSLRSLTLKNDFDVALEVESIQFARLCRDIEIDEFFPGVVAPSALFPTITLRVHPRVDAAARTRICSLRVETNASIHHIPLVVHTGLVRVTSSRPVQHQHQVEDSSAVECGGYDEDHVPGPTVPVDLHVSDVRVDRGVLPVRGLKMCRTIVVDLGQVASTGELEEVVNITNAGPTNLQMAFLPSAAQEASGIRFEMATTTTFHEDLELSTELATLGAAWSRLLHRDQHPAMIKPPPPQPVANTVSLPPGQLMSLHLRLLFRGQEGAFTDRIATIDTQFETIRVYLRYEAMPGTITPVLKTVELPAIHPGRVGYVDIPFQSTFQHDVVAQSAVISTVGDAADDAHHIIGLWRLEPSFAANATTHVSVMYFPPSFYGSCQRGRFYADCFVRDKASLLPPTSSYSEFGSLVTANDLQAFDVRHRAWVQEDGGKAKGAQRGARVDMDLAVVTKALHATPVRITAYVVRPRFFHHDTNVRDAMADFPLTEVFHQVAAYINVHNPSDYAMDMELTVAERDRHLFYECDDDMTERECLREWQDIAREHVELTKKKKQKKTVMAASSAACEAHEEEEATCNDLAESEPGSEPTTRIAPFFFKHRIDHVAGRKQAQLGPIYFFPSHVDHWDTHIYIRNELTHIEPVILSGTSGQGELAISLLPSFITQAENENVKSNEAWTGPIEFELSEADSGDQAFGPVPRTLQLTNKGTFQLTLDSIQLPAEAKEDPVANSAHSTAFALASLGTSTGVAAVQAMTKIVLAPNETISLTVAFTAGCYHSQRESELAISTQDGTVRYQLIGRISTSAAFQCRRHKWSAWAKQWSRSLWMAATALAMVAVVAAMWSLRFDAATILRSSASKQDRMNWSERNRTNESTAAEAVEEVAMRENDSTATTDTDTCTLLEELARIEAKMSIAKHPQQSIAAPSSAVSKLLASRQQQQGQMASNVVCEESAHAVCVDTTDADAVAAAAVKPKEAEADPVVFVVHASVVAVATAFATNEELLQETPSVVDDYHHVEQPHKSDVDVGGISKSDNQKDQENEMQVPVGELPQKTSSQKTKKKTKDKNKTAVAAADVVVSVSVPAAATTKQVDSEKEEEAAKEFDNQVDAEDQDDAVWLTPEQTQQEDAEEGELIFGESLGLEDVWNALAFESLQFEIGRLLVTDDSRASPPALNGNLSSSPLVTTTPTTVVLHEPEDAIMAPSAGGGAAMTNGGLGGLTALSMAPPLLPMSSLFASPMPLRQVQEPAKSKKPAPPGFTPADANPAASRAAFGRRLLEPPTSASLPAFPAAAPAPALRDNAVSSMQSAFSGRYSLFGSSFQSDTTNSPFQMTTTARTGTSNSNGSMAGRIGSSRLTQMIGDSSSSSGRKASPPLASLSARSRLAALGGIEFSASASHDLTGHE